MELIDQLQLPRLFGRGILTNRINIPLSATSAFLRNVETNGRSEKLPGPEPYTGRGCACCLRAPCSVRVRDRYAIARESADRKHENKT